MAVPLEAGHIPRAAAWKHSAIWPPKTDVVLLIRGRARVQQRCHFGRVTGLGSCIQRLVHALLGHCFCCHVPGLGGCEARATTSDGRC